MFFAAFFLFGVYCQFAYFLSYLGKGGSSCKKPPWFHLNFLARKISPILPLMQFLTLLTLTIIFVIYWITVHNFFFWLNKLKLKLKLWLVIHYKAFFLKKATNCIVPRPNPRNWWEGKVIVAKQMHGTLLKGRVLLHCAAWVLYFRKIIQRQTYIIKSNMVLRQQWQSSIEESKQKFIDRQLEY